ncbi:MAG: putative sugar nucleotidyl transferase [Phycisphaerales bacterium]|jgi:UDP-N-acetylglucosamine diphosphorylase/glucosamine-1-phosphate N-acetyltransferase
MRRWILLDDGGGRFGPLTDLRSIIEVRTGASTILERFRRAWGEPRAVAVPKALRGLARERGLPEYVSDGDGPIEIWNARLRGDLSALADSPAPGEAWCTSDGEFLAASLDPREAAALLGSGELDDRIRRVVRSDLSLISRPWHILDDLDARLRQDLSAIADDEGFSDAGGTGFERVGDHPIRTQATARIGRAVVLDATAGPIVIGAGASIGHGSILEGPVFVGPGCVVAPRTHLKRGVSLGPVCKVGGEIGATIFQGHANKVHEGHLGDAWVGEWANFGASTVNSNLLNTYGEVSMRLAPDGPSERTGRTAMGCLVGDHVKFAIGTRITTGACFGTGSMIAVDDPPRCVGRFRWLVDRGETGYRYDRFLEVATIAAGRRGTTFGPAYLERLASLHADAARGG